MCDFNDSQCQSMGSTQKSQKSQHSGITPPCTLAVEQMKQRDACDKGSTHGSLTRQEQRMPLRR